MVLETSGDTPEVVKRRTHQFGSGHEYRVSWIVALIKLKKKALAVLQEICQTKRRMRPLHGGDEMELPVRDATSARSS